MKKLKVYLDTSVINHLFADDAPDARKNTHDLFNFFIKPKVFDTYISPIVINEIENTTLPEKKAQLLDVIEINDFIF